MEILYTLGPHFGIQSHALIEMTYMFHRVRFLIIDYKDRSNKPVG